jgi:hypothetical protein
MPHPIPSKTLLSLTLLTTALLHAQTTPEPPIETLHLTSQLVVLDATVELRKTHSPIPGLAPEDFVLFEDRQPETITSVSKDTLPSPSPFSSTPPTLSAQSSHP